MKEKISGFDQQRKDLETRVKKRGEDLEKRAAERARAEPLKKAEISNRREKEDREWSQKRSMLDDMIKSRQVDNKKASEERDRVWFERQADLDWQLKDQRRKAADEQEHQEGLRADELRAQQEKLSAEARQRRDDQNKQRQARSAANNKSQEKARVRAEDNEQRAAHLQKLLEDLQARHSSTIYQKETSLDDDWKKLEGVAAGDQTVGLSDVPFPRATQLRRVQNDKKALQIQILRWHPDKFFQKLGHRLRETEKDAILERVKETFQLVQEMRAC